MSERLWEVRLELIYYLKVGGGDADHASENAREFLLDEISDPSQRGDWIRIIETEVREI